MPTDKAAAALEHLDTAADPSPQAAPGPAGDLADLAATIRRLQALLAAGTRRSDGGSAAVERIADIAFILHEREVEASLCDALDAAVREISNAGAVQQASVQRAEEAAELLRDLSLRINAMIAAAEGMRDPLRPAPADAEPASAGADFAPAPRDEDERDKDDEAADELSVPPGLFDSDMPEDDEFARTVAALAAALPSVAQEPESSGSDADVVTVASTDLADVPECNVAATAPGLPPLAGDAAGTTEPADLQSAAAAVPPVPESSDAATEAAASLPEASRTERSSGDQDPEIEATPENVEAAIAEPGWTEAPPPRFSAPVDSGQGDSTASEEPAADEHSAGNSALGSDLSAIELPTGEAFSAAERQAGPAETAEREAIAPTPLGESMEQRDPNGQEGDIANGPEARTARIDHEPGHDAPIEFIAAAPSDRDAMDQVQTDDTQLPSEREQVPPIADATPPSAVQADQIERVIEIEAVDQVTARAEEAGHLPEAAMHAVPHAATESALDPDEDPGDLFEPVGDEIAAIAATETIAALPPGEVTADFAPAGASVDRVSESPIAALPLLGSPQPPELGGTPALGSITASPAASVEPEPRPQEPATPRSPPAPAAAPRPPANDPLAAVRVLSEEEMIALFS